MLDAASYFEQVKQALPGDAEARAQALHKAEALGLPTRRLEHWHYTDLARLLKKPAQENAALVATDFSALNPSEVRFEGGVMQASDDAGLADWPALSPTAAEHASDAMVLYNQALAQAGVVLELPEGGQKTLLVTTQGSAPQHLSHHISLARGAELILIDDNMASGYSNVAWDIELAEDSKLTFVHLQQAGRQVATSTVRLAENATLTRLNLLSGQDMARHAGTIALQAAGARAELHSAILGTDTAHNDVTYVIDHQAADTQSNTTSYHALAGQARGVFQGKVIVQRDAQRVDAQMQARAMMLSDGPEMDAKPELEIYADDVQCAHGTAIGEIDADALFFLRARGLDEATARQFLITGFIEQVLDACDHEPLVASLRAHIETKIATVLGQGSAS
jgi:Fe-S cluster assembly protein SufD